MSFNKDIENFKRKTEKAASMVFRGTALDLFGRIIKRTPVGNPSAWKFPERAPKGYTGGRLRANWQASINAPVSGEVNSTSGKVASDSAKSATGRAKLGDSIFFINNLPYAGAVENGHSRQAPQGMVKVTIEEFQSIVKKRARQVKK